jgi:single-strand DNA-binding protein
MSQYLNEVNLIGYVGDDAETSETNGTKRTLLSVATKRSWKDDKEQWQSRTEWHNVVAWNGTAAVAAQCKKGNHVRIKGEMRSREIEIEGVKHKVFEVVASEVHNLRPERREAAE